MKKLLLFALSAIPFLATAQSPAYSFDKTSAVITLFDTTTLAPTIGATATSTAGTVTGFLGSDTDPCGNVYVVYKVNSGRNLGTIDLTTGVITDIGILSDLVANISFIPDGTLYAVTGNGAATSETLYTVNIATAAMTLATTLTTEDDGESIEFCPDNNLMYRFSGWGNADCIMQSIDLTTFATTVISYSGVGATTISNVGGSTYAGNGLFLCSDLRLDDFYWIDTAGVVSAAIGNANNLKGLVFDGPYVPALASVNGLNSFCPNGSLDLICDSATTGTYDWHFNGTTTGITTSTITINTGGSYTCSITTSCGVIESDTLIINEFTLPIVNINPSPTANFCLGDSVLLTGNDGAMNQWYMDGNIIAGATDSTHYATAVGSYNMMITNSDGCSDTAAVATIAVDTCALDVNVNSNKTVSNIYPNPTNDSFTIEFNSKSNNASIRLFGIEGKLLKIINEGSINGENLNVDISDLNPGTYFMHVNTESKNSIHKIVKF
jgi:hypothetical protein